MVAIPSNRVNVSYFDLKRKKENRSRCSLSRNPLKSGQCFLQFDIPVHREVVKGLSQSPQIGSMFPTFLAFSICSLTITCLVAIPSNRVNVSYSERKERRNYWKTSQSPQIGSMFPTCLLLNSKKYFAKDWVAIPSNRVNVSYSTHLFLRIIGNLIPLLREPHYFYAFLFPI